jgi:mono/diheme cytochrome c family protein
VRKWLIGAVVLVVALFVAAQAVPYGRDHTNPPVTREVRWDSSRTRELAAGACFDCHSNLTDWK